MGVVEHFNIKNPVGDPVRVSVIFERLDYSDVKLFIPTERKNGKEVTTLDKSWYVYFWFRNPKTGKIDSNSKFKRSKGLNSYKTIAARKAYGNNLKKTYTRLLQEGYNPWENKIFKPEEAPEKMALRFQHQETTLKKAVAAAIENKSLTWEQSTKDGIVLRVSKFMIFAKKNGFDQASPNSLNIKHVSEYLKELQQSGLSETSVNNYKSAISTVFTQIVKNGGLKQNFVLNIDKLEAKPIKNHPFTEKQIEDIRDYLLINDPYLLKYLQALAYSFFRNREVCRLKISDIDMDNRLMTDLTKTKRLEKVYIIDQLYAILKDLKINTWPKDYYLFTYKNEPGEWEVKDLKSKVTHFGRRFKKVKKHFGYGPEYGIYSFRHSFALNVFDNLIAQGLQEQEAMLKMLPITRHESVESLSAYLREKKRMVPQNFTKNITINL